MRTKTLVCLAMIGSMGLSSVAAFAQDHHDRDHHPGPVHHAPVRIEHHDEFHYGARGPEWHRGGHIPPMYRDRQYVVSDWRAHHLRQPPRGYHWVQVGGDYVLVAIASGVIADLLLNH